MRAATFVLLLTACRPVAVPAPDVVDPDALVARALAEPAPGPMYATFAAVVTTGNQRITANGTLVVAPPDRFRVELRGPIGPPQVVVTCDGHDVRAYLAQKNAYYTATDADGTLGALVGAGEGLRGAAVATSLLMGRLPILPGTPGLRASGPVATATWAREDGASLTLGVDGATAHLVDARATDASGSVLFTGTWKPDAFPRTLSLALPTLGAAADIRFDEWKPAVPTESAFVLEQPAGSTSEELKFGPVEGAGD